MLFCHVHVPKTGGTSLNRLLEGWFPGAFEVLHHPDPNFSLDIDALADYLTQKSYVRCISSHNLKRFPAVVAGRRVHYFTILREPLDRTISLLTFIKKSGHKFSAEHKSTLPPNFEEMSELEILDRWAEWGAMDRRSGKIESNPSGCIFLDTDFHCDFVNNRRACEAALAAKCIAVLNRFLYVGDFACFRESIQELARRIRALGASECNTDWIPEERISREMRGDLDWLEEGQHILNEYLDGLAVQGMVYRHFAHQNRRRVGA